MSNKGWISLHRSVTDHWLFDEDRKFSKFEAWIDLLLMVNHTDKKMMLGNELITIKRGQKVTSIRKLCERWNWSNNKVKNFLNVLEADGMLTVKSDSKKTLVTVVNYDVYQNEDIEKRHQSDTKATQKHHESDAKAFQKHTNNNVNNVNNENNDNKDVSDEDFQKVADYFQSQIGQLFPNDYQILNELCSEFNLSLVCKAIEVSKLNNITKRPMNYMRKCLIDWKTRGLNSREEVERYLNGNGKQDAKKEFKELTPQQIYEVWK